MGGDEDDEEASLRADAEARRIGGLGTPQRLYHYTDRASATSIQQLRELRASRTGLAGAGVYATALHPTNCTKVQIEANNWGHRTFSGTWDDYVVELDVQ